MAIEYESISELKNHLPQAVENPVGEIVITKTGKPQAVLLGIANYNALRALAELARMPSLLSAALTEHHRFQQGGNEDAMTLDQLDEFVRRRAEESSST
jgi:prevent-host-death family protein